MKTRADRAAAIVTALRAHTYLRAFARNDHFWHTIFVEEARGTSGGFVCLYDNGATSVHCFYYREEVAAAIATTA